MIIAANNKLTNRILNPFHVQPVHKYTLACKSIVFTFRNCSTTLLMLCCYWLKKIRFEIKVQNTKENFIQRIAVKYQVKSQNNNEM